MNASPLTSDETAEVINLAVELFRTTWSYRRWRRSAEFIPIEERTEEPDVVVKMEDADWRFSKRMSELFTQDFVAAFREGGPVRQ